MIIWSRETGPAVPSRVSLLISILRLNMVLHYGIPPDFRGGVHLSIETVTRHRVSPEFIGSRNRVPMAFTAESPLAQASKPQGSSTRVLPWQVTMTNMRLSFPHYICMYVCMTTHITRVWINRVRLLILLVVSSTRKMNISLSVVARENLVSRDGFGSPVPRHPARLYTQAESGAYLRHSFRVPRRRPFIYLKLPYAIGSVLSLSGHAIAYQWRSLPRVRRHRASKPQGSSERALFPTPTIGIKWACSKYRRIPLPD